MNAKLNTFLLGLYRTARTESHEQLRIWTFKALSNVVSFDSAFWFRGVAFERQVMIHSYFLHRQPETLIQEYVRDGLWEEDEIYRRLMVGQRGKAVRLSFDEFPSARFRDFLRRNHQQHLITIALTQEVPQLSAGMSLYRNELGSPFSDEDACTLEMVAPHVVDAWRESWLREVIQAARSPTKIGEFGVGVLMPDLMISEAHDSFVALVQQEWPGWQGPWLPEPLHEHISLKAPVQPWIGKQVAAYNRTQAGGAMLLLLRKGHPLDRLAPRKRAAALMFAAGRSQSEVAADLRLSASTVNNYLVDVYRELNIKDKSDLSVLVSRLQP